MSSGVDEGQHTGVGDVRPARSELIAAGKAVNDRMTAKERSALGDALELGSILARLREECGHGEWLPALEEMGVRQQRASDCLRIIKLPPVVLSRCETLNDARRAIAEAREEPEEPEAAPPPEPDEPDPPPTQSRAERVGQVPPTPFVPACDRCGERHRPATACGAAIAERFEKRLTSEAISREPGDDSAEIEEEKAGRPPQPVAQPGRSSTPGHRAAYRCACRGSTARARPPASRTAQAASGGPG